MKFLCKGLILLLSIAAGLAADKNAPFRPGPAASYPRHQTISKLTIAADVYAARERTKTAFGKFDPAKYGILPILVVMRNDSAKALRLDRMRVEYIRPDRRSIDPIPAEDIPYLRGSKKPKISRVPYPNPVPGLGGRSRKNPLGASAIQERAFTARMLPPNDSASGFFYFQTANHTGAMLYITGVSEAATGQELFYFEIPLQ